MTADTIDFDKRQTSEPDFSAFEWYVIKTNIKCESRAARSLHDAGYGAYLPKLKFEIRHHRTKKWLTKEANLFRQYLFAGMPIGTADWFSLRRCDGVEYVLGIDEPMPVKTGAVRDFWEREHKLEFDTTKEARLARREIGRTRRETTRMKFPPGSRFKTRVSDVPFFGKVVSVNGRGAIMAMVEMFGRMTPMEIDPEKAEIIPSRAA